ncbi:hypothetical protein K438DRAFT_1987093 [Mycena galopus ATCC 62051]|nr:hypothetical protein K438DRAFT_1987093 [Mycena galopus ATCC 62051]
MGFDILDDMPEPAQLAIPRVIKPSDPALARFRGLRDTYLSNLLRRDGCLWQQGPDRCFGCQRQTDETNPQIFRCKSCFGDELVCASCLVTRHAKDPLHRIERWNGRFFEASALKTLGLRVQLGHIPGERCSEPLQLHTQFIVLHMNGIHEVAVDSCDCEHRAWAGAPEEQLLRAGWFPATDDRPRTCATTELLDSFVAQTYQAKTTMYYSVLEKLSNNAGVKPPNRYHAFLRMVREYSHLLMLKRAGCGHAKTGVIGTKQGELAVKCPSCPDPGVNLPAGWEDASPQDKFLYIVFIAIDACFCLKCRLVSSELKGPTLGPGWSYMVEAGQYCKFLLTITDQKEMSTCSGLAALDHANTKFSRGSSATGVGMGVCARHEFVQPNGVGDLQKGERFRNMDWIFLSILLHLHPRLRKIISYDIACQWWKNLKGRVKKMPGHVHLKIVLALLRFVVPKMHIKGHNHDCQATYSLDYVPGSAQTDGEGIERPWAHIGGVGSSTKETGPGSREDTLNGHWGSWNWQKLLGLGEALQTKLDRAQSKAAAQLEAFTQFSMQQAARVPAWREMVENFERDLMAKNPYRMTSKGIMEAQVLLQFEQEEAERVRAGVPGIHSVSPSSFVAAGLEVEDEQRRVRIQVELKKRGTTSQLINIAALRRALNRSIQRLCTLQATYTLASILALGQHKNVSPDEQPENVPLFLPSALTAAQRTAESVKDLAAMENLLRDSAGTPLQARHQGANTRARTLVERNESKIRLHSEKYQMAWEARRRLADGDVEKVGWQVLRKEDIWCMEDAEELVRNADKWRAREDRRHRQEDALPCDGELPPLGDEERAQRERGGENVRQVSWIWTSTGLAGNDAQPEEAAAALQIEWCKAYAWTRRWQEEVCLVQEEVWRAGVTLEAWACTWEERAKWVPVGVMEWAEWDAAGAGRWAVEHAEGAIAYTVKQAAMFRGIASRLVVSMTEERRGRGKRRRMVYDDEVVPVEGGEGDELEDELEDLRGVARPGHRVEETGAAAGGSKGGTGACVPLVGGGVAAVRKVDGPVRVAGGRVGAAVSRPCGGWKRMRWKGWDLGCAGARFFGGKGSLSNVPSSGNAMFGWCGLQTHPVWRALLVGRAGFVGGAGFGAGNGRCATPIGTWVVGPQCTAVLGWVLEGKDDTNGYFAARGILPAMLRVRVPWECAGVPGIPLQTKYDPSDTLYGLTPDFAKRPTRVVNTFHETGPYWGPDAAGPAPAPADATSPDTLDVAGPKVPDAAAPDAASAPDAAMPDTVSTPDAVVDTLDAAGTVAGGLVAPDAAAPGPDVTADRNTAILTRVPMPLVRLL